MPDYNRYYTLYNEQELWVQNLILAGLALLAVLILWILYRLFRQPNEIIAFKTERGRVTVARKAIGDLIQRAAARTPGVERCRSKIRSKRGKLSIQMRIHLKANHDLREVERRLESQVADTLRYSLGFTHLGRINTRVVKLVGDPQPVLHYEQRPVPEEEVPASVLPPPQKTAKVTPRPVVDEEAAAWEEAQAIRRETVTGEPHGDDIQPASDLDSDTDSSVSSQQKP